MIDPSSGVPDPARPTKTSLTDPLVLTAVGTPGGGRIGMTLCPGKRQPHAITGPWERDLALDMDAIAAFGATTLATLMETGELEAAAVSTDVLAHAARQRGMTWLHLPIADFCAPDARFEETWAANGPDIRAQLLAAKSIVLHCRGGRGRSGMLAARILVELGIAPEAAVIMVRAANPYAIETEAQEEHIRNCRRQPA